MASFIIYIFNINVWLNSCIISKSSFQQVQIPSIINLGFGSAPTVRSLGFVLVFWCWFLDQYICSPMKYLQTRSKRSSYYVLLKQVIGTYQEPTQRSWHACVEQWELRKECPRKQISISNVCLAERASWPPGLPSLPGRVNNFLSGLCF